MRTTIPVLLVTLTLLPLASIVNPPVRAENITIETTLFANGKPEMLIEFPSAGIDTSAALSLQTGLYIDEVRLNVSSVEQPSGSRAYPFNIGIDFGADQSLEWAFIGQGYGSLGFQNLFVNSKPYMNVSVPMGGGFNDTAAIRLPKDAVVKTATMNASAGTRIGTPGKILVLNGANPYYGWDTDPVNRLKKFTNDFKTVDRIDANTKTPTWDEIKDYSAILTATEGYYYGRGYQDSNSLGNLLADYVDAGGSVVCMFMTFYDGIPYRLGGRFYNDQYYVIKPSYSYTSSSAGIGEILIQNHPVMANVSSISFPYYGYTYRSYNPTLTTGGETIAKWGDGHIMAAQKNVGGVDRVDINMVPYSYDVSWPYLAYYGDGDDLMRNALLFGGRKPIDARVDIFNDSTIELDRKGFMGNYTFPDFSAQLNSYLATAEVTYEDKWGNRFVDVPINVSSPGGGRLSFGNLAITYDYTVPVSLNPHDGNLTNTVADLMSSIVGEEQYNIPIYVSSTSAGKLKLSGLYIRATPPRHAPRIDSFYPALETSVTEGTTLEFGVNATDIYGNEIGYAWFHNDLPMTGAIGDRMSLGLGYEDAGNHTVTVKVSNAISERTYTNLTWDILVRNVNRGPRITEFSPLSDPEVPENGTQEFSVEAEDPDIGDTMVFAWFLDGKAVAGATGGSFRYAPGYFDSGPHALKATVTDREGAGDSRIWQIKVLDVNVPPVLVEWSPRYDPRIEETESLTFSVTATDIDRSDRLVVSWSMDGAPVFVGNPFTYVTDYRSAGEHTVVASVSDGDAEVSHGWRVTVVDLNRPPRAAVDSPADHSEFVEGQSIRFSADSASDPDDDVLSFLWKEGGVNVSDQKEFERPFPPGLHTLTLEVRDPSGGLATATVHFRVRFWEISVAIGVDRLEISAGDRMSLVLTMTNVGDTNATDVPVELLVDGQSIGTTKVADFRPGAVERAIFEWKATKGPHTITARVAGGTVTKEITVEAAPPPPPGAGIADLAWPVVLVVVLVALVAFGGMVLKKK